MSINSTGISESQVRMQNMAMGLGSTQSSALGAQSPNFHVGNIMLAAGNLLESLTPLLMQFAQRAPMAATPMANPLGGALMQQLPQLLGLLSQFGMGGSPMMNPQMNPMMNPMGVGPQMNPMMNPMAMGPQMNPLMNPMMNPMGVGPQMNPMMNPLMNPMTSPFMGAPTNFGMPQGVPPQFSQPGFPGTPGGVPSAPNAPTVVPNTGEVKYDAAGNVKMDKDRAVREISRNFDQLTQGKDNYITKDDLRAIADGGLQRHQKSANYTPELRAAAKYMLDNPEAFKELETSDSKAQGFKGKADGKIGKGDTTAAMQKTGFSVGEKDALQTVAKYGDELFHKHHLVSKEDLQKIVKEGKMPNGKAAPADLKEAAQLLLSQPETFTKLDNAMKIRKGHHGDQHGDGKFSLNDLRETLKGADTKPGPDGGGIFSGVNQNSLLGKVLTPVNELGNSLQPSQNTKDNVSLAFQSVPTSVF